MQCDEDGAADESTGDEPEVDPDEEPPDEDNDQGCNPRKSLDNT